MTATSFPDASFGLVLDKGGLDALMGDGDAGSVAAGEKLLREVDRLLRPSDGAYVCVTLAQEHVLGAQLFGPYIGAHIEAALQRDVLCDLESYGHRSGDVVLHLQVNTAASAPDCTFVAPLTATWVTHIGRPTVGNALVAMFRVVLSVRAQAHCCAEARGVIRCGVADLLLRSFRGTWAMTLHKPPPTPDMATAPLQPLVAVVERVAALAGDGATAKPPPVTLAFKAAKAGPDAQQMQSVMKVLAKNGSISSASQLLWKPMQRLRALLLHN